ncbi:swr1 complex component [Tulasnella sp. 418]|nr:swr1 complex component [Tulasnella sp. 418]
MEERNQQAGVEDDGGESRMEDLDVLSRQVEQRKTKMMATRRNELKQIIDRHDDLVREMFHLERFVTLTGYDPKIAKEDNSTVFQEFRRSYDLFEKAPSVGRSSRSTRNAISGTQELLTAPQTPSASGSSRTIASPSKGKGKAFVSQTTPNSSRAVPRPNTGVGLVTPKRQKGLIVPPATPRMRSPPLTGTLSLPPKLQDTPTPSPKKSHRPQSPHTPRSTRIRIPRTAKGFATLPSAPNSPATPDALSRRAVGIKHKATEPPPETPRILKRIKLVHRPRAEYSDPRQIPPPPKFGRSLSKLLDSFILLDDDTEVPTDEVHRLEQRAREEAKLRNRIEALRAAGSFVHLENKVDVKPPDEPKRPIGHQDHLLAHVASMSKYIREEGKARVAGAKRIAKMMEKHFERMAGADTREQKAEEKRRALLVRTTLREVVKEWRLAVAVVRARRKEEQRAEKIRKGRQHLNAVLEQSTQVLEAQHADLAHGARRRHQTTSRSASRSSGGLSGWGSNSEQSITRPSTPLGSTHDDGRRSSQASDDDDEDDESRIDEELSMFGSGSNQEEEAMSDTLEDPTNITSPPNDEDEYDVYTREDPSFSFQFHAPDDASDAILPALQEESSRQSQLSPLGSGPSSPLLLSQPGGDDEDFVNDEKEDLLEMDHQLDVEMEREEEDLSDDSEMDGLAKDAEVPIEQILERYGLPVSQADIPEPHTPDALEQLSTPTPSGTSLTTRRRSSRKASTVSKASPSELEVSDRDVEFEEPDIMELEKEDREMDIEMEAAEGDESDGSEVDGLANDADIPIEELLRRYGYEVGPENGGGDAEEEEMDEDAADKPSSPPPEISPEVDLVTEMEEGSSSRSVTPEPEPAQLSEEEIEDADIGEDEEEEDEEGSEVVDEDEEGSLIHAKSPDLDEGNDGLSVPPPFLLRGTLRPYQQAGLEWLASLHANNTNGILADEMGLGKTIQTISLLGYLACSKGIWGPHLIIVPTSVLLNWEMEFKRFLPGFRTLPYYGTPKERAKRRQGWNTEHSFNVCITSYQLALADQQIFRRKKWEYMVLDEAHNIKNFKSKRWETLLCFNAAHRLLLTGTPLQNNLMELWSLLYFLMPDEGLARGDAESQSFVRREDFKDLFQNPVEKAIEDGRSMNIETRDTVQKLHTLLRPYLLRRLKSEVEKQLPAKYEHIVYCRLSKRQRFLYDEFMSRAATKETLASGNYLSIVNCLMQLRKVCNHPDLFEVRPIVTSFVMSRSAIADYEIKELLIRRRFLASDPMEQSNLDFLGFQFTQATGNSLLVARSTRRLDASSRLPHINDIPGEPPPIDLRTIAGFKARQAWERKANTVSRWQHISYVNRQRCSLQPMYSSELLRVIKIHKPLLPLSIAQLDTRNFLKRVDAIPGAVKSYRERLEQTSSIIDRFAFATPKAVAHGVSSMLLTPDGVRAMTKVAHDLDLDSLHLPAVKLQIAFPEASLLQYDCGKLQELASLLRERNAGGHRVLIFTQMTKVLDILETFLNHHGYRYLRLDGATKIEQRQIITERFNLDSRIFAFIASSRSGGIGINLTGADTVIFYDSDYNPSMDRQCEDRFVSIRCFSDS